MEIYDTIIVGAGSAGCVLANRLSADPRHRVLLLEAGREDRSLLIRMPKGVGKLLDDPAHTWRFTTTPEPGREPAETWLRGRTLGGSSAVNGMMYVRGQPQDYDGWEALGNRGWGWSAMREAFRQIEDHELGDDGLRGTGGPLPISNPPERDSVSEAVIEAGTRLGLTRKHDLNRLDQEGIGYHQRTIRDGERWSAARAFLAPVRKRENLCVVTETLVEQLLFENGRVLGIRARSHGEVREFRGHEIILSAGAIMSPVLLQCSGVGDASALRALGIDVVADRPGVGRNLREHRCLPLQFKLLPQVGYNIELAGLRLLRQVLRYQLFRRGAMTTGAYDVAAFVKTRPSLERPDAQLMMAPLSMRFDSPVKRLEKQAGLQCLAYCLRPESQGSVLIDSPRADAAPSIRPRYLTAVYDREVIVAAYRYLRRLFAEAPIASLLAGETLPAAELQTGAEIIDYVDRYGLCGFHAAGTCRMGADAASVVDPQLRVRGVRGLRVMDCSVMPTLVSGNTNGPVMAMAWRAADLIIEERRQGVTT